MSNKEQIKKARVKLKELKKVSNKSYYQKQQIIKLESIFDVMRQTGTRDFKLLNDSYNKKSKNIESPSKMNNKTLKQQIKQENFINLLKRADTAKREQIREQAKEVKQIQQRKEKNIQRIKKAREQIKELSKKTNKTYYEKQKLKKLKEVNKRIETSSDKNYVLQNRSYNQQIKLERAIRQANKLDNQIREAQKMGIDARDLIKARHRQQTIIRDVRTKKYDIELDLVLDKGFIDVEGKKINVSFDSSVTDQQAEVLNSIKRELEEYSIGDQTRTNFYHKYGFKQITERTIMLYAKGEGLI